MGSSWSVHLPLYLSLPHTQRNALTEHFIDVYTYEMMNLYVLLFSLLIVYKVIAVKFFLVYALTEYTHKHTMGRALCNW